MRSDGHARTRFTFGLAFLAMIVLGLASRRFASHLPTFLADFAGDTLWAAMAFFGLSSFMSRVPLLRRMLIALAFCYLIELSQLYQAPWINRVRRTTLGGLALGRGFLWSDLVCYTAGVTLAAASEWITTSTHRGLNSNQR
jgi:hypothetical protein